MENCYQLLQWARMRARGVDRGILGEPETVADIIGRWPSAVFTLGAVAGNHSGTPYPSAKPTIRAIAISSIGGAPTLRGPTVAERSKERVNVTLARKIASVGGPELGRERDPIKNVQGGCPHADREIQILQASTESQLDDGFAALGRQRPDALLVVPTPFFTANESELSN